MLLKNRKVRQERGGETVNKEDQKSKKTGRGRKENGEMKAKDTEREERIGDEEIKKVNGQWEREKESKKQVYVCM